VLLKGGFVCVPVALAAKLHNVPAITHDSDAVPGLSNRLAGRYAKIHAVAMPARYYNYPTQSIRVVGVPINPEFATHTKATKELGKKYELKTPGPVVLITGGSQGSRRLNVALIEMLPQLLKKYPKIHVFHHVGVGNANQYPPMDNMLQKHVTIFDFSDALYEMSALSDVVVTRAGATTLAEFASQGKACIIVPHPELAGDHQTKNAKVYGDADAGLVLPEEKILRDSNSLFEAISDMLSNDKKRKRYADNITLLNPKIPSAVALAKLIIEISDTEK
jgi:UDP-N-acetylglucosamine--N-acetylmuramyl-(pentapeptide) pyrophosphoryl-undecaprenol N-acetylglucosamine transferase